MLPFMFVPASQDHREVDMALLGRRLRMILIGALLFALLPFFVIRDVFAVASPSAARHDGSAR